MMTARRSEQGTVALEFALLLPVILLFVGTLVITGMRGIYSALAEHEARVAARVASIRIGQTPSSPYPTADDICTSSDRFLAFAGSVHLVDECIVSNDPDTSQDAWGDGDMVTVTLTYRLTPLVALSNFVSGSFSANSLSTVKQSASVMRE